MGSVTSAVSLSVIDNPLDRYFKLRNILYHSPPHHLIIDSKIMMYQFVTHLCHIGPRDLWVLLTELFLQLLLSGHNPIFVPGPRCVKFPFALGILSEADVRFNSFDPETRS